MTTVGADVTFGDGFLGRLHAWAGFNVVDASSGIALEHRDAINSPLHINWVVGLVSISSEAQDSLILHWLVMYQLSLEASLSIF